MTRTVGLLSALVLFIDCGPKHKMPPPQQGANDPAAVVEVDMPRYTIALPVGWPQRKRGDTIEATNATRAEVRASVIITRANTIEGLATEQKNAIAKGYDVLRQQVTVAPPSVRTVYEGLPDVGGRSAGLPQAGLRRHRWIEPVFSATAWRRVPRAGPRCRTSTLRATHTTR
jgi:hypothetical protein